MSNYLLPYIPHHCSVVDNQTDAICEHRVPVSFSRGLFPEDCSIGIMIMFPSISRIGLDWRNTPHVRNTRINLIALQHISQELHENASLNSKALIFRCDIRSSRGRGRSCRHVEGGEKDYPRNLSLLLRERYLNIYYACIEPPSHACAPRAAIFACT